MPYGQFWYGKRTNFPGFMYKSQTAGGVRRNPSKRTGCIGDCPIWNKYTPGSGVGGTNTSVRRAKTRLATTCYSSTGQPCGNFFTRL